MKIKLKYLLMLLISAKAFSSNTFDVDEVAFLGDVTQLSEATQQGLIEETQRFRGQNKTIDDLLIVRDKFQEILKKNEKDNYAINIAEQKIINNRIIFYISYLNGVIYKGTQGFDEKNIENSLPSLKQDKILEDGRQWFDQRELNMALENPLKTTFLNYALDSQTQSSTLTVYSHAPNKHYSYIAVDNYGGREFDYARLTLGHINANLTGKDDVLSFHALTNFYQPHKSYALGLNYLYPFYAQHQTLGLNLSYSMLDSYESESLATGLDSKYAKGKTFVSGLNWSYFIPHFDLGESNQFKLNAGYVYRHYNQRSMIAANQGALNYGSDTAYSTGGISLGLSGEIKPITNMELKFNALQSYYSKKIPGASHLNQLKALGYDRDYYLTNYQFNFNWNFVSNWHIKTALNGQYSHQKIPSIDYQSITGMYNVRGFRYNGFSADKGLVWRSELTTPSYSLLNIHHYAFYDWGKFRYNDSNRLGGVISSAGLGLRAQYKGANLDLFVAQRLHNANLDRLDNGKQAKKTSFWVKLGYSF